MEKFYSHKNKELKTHHNGVCEKLNKRGFVNETTLFIGEHHDIGKLNPEFGKYLFGMSHGYKEHSYLSVYIALNLIYNNDNYINYKKFFIENKFDLNIIVNIIRGHHSNLNNIDNLLDEDKMNEIIPAIEETKLNVCKYFKDSFNFSIQPENLLKHFNSQIFVNEWKKNVLGNYFKTIFTFGQLIEADRRDASNNTIYDNDNINYFNKTFNNNLNKVLYKLELNNELNKVRTEIRNESVSNIKYHLKTSNNRMFEITSPTGSGKTFMLLKVASTIQDIKGDYGIIMALPFNSIIDQTYEICSNKLLIDILNYTSASNSSYLTDNRNKNKSDDAVKDNILKYVLSEDTFDSPFVLTTFVQFFQTLIGSNRSVLMKLPNFSKRIFLIDEFQSLPSNLYTFFYGLLQFFCETFDCYCILSTATMPNFELNDKDIENKKKIDAIFNNYKKPISLINSENYYTSKCFNRYKIINLKEKNLQELCDLVSQKGKENSLMVIMNTISDSREVYNNLNHENKYLLNGNFTSIDKIKIIESVKNDLENNKNVLLVTTQIVEAGVDIDFPTVFREICPLPSLIQSSGRCNRNGNFDLGYVYLFKYYTKDKDNPRCYTVYKDGFDINFTDNNINNTYESELFNIQKKYYNCINKHRTVGTANILKKNIKDDDTLKKEEKTQKVNLLDYLYNGKIKDLGEYRLIEDTDDFTYFVGAENKWDEFQKKYEELSNKQFSYENKNDIKNLIKAINNECINVKKNKELPYRQEILGIRNLMDKCQYNNKTGLNIEYKKQSYLII